MNLRAEITGAREALAYMDRVNASAQRLNGQLVVVGTNAKYAFGIIFGYRRSGRVARKAGGSLSLPSAYEAVKPQIAPTIARLLPEGPDAAFNGVLRLGYRIEAGAKAREVVKSGNLRRSYVTVAR